MSDIAIKCEGLSKQYRLGERESYKALRDVITDAATAPFRRLRSALGNGNSTVGTQNSPTFWALEDVTFDVKWGEVLGVIGRNGAGKSTLLKILSRITKPTRGHAEIHGRVGSLLEVGTGFHPELTGRENIYLNGAILGMRKAELNHKFDDIVAFAEVEEFIDTPVKRYSSGMYVRLAFAVAAHMETEVLLVDEVLAVGDAQFQKKCLGKMGEVARGGRTILFVSHNMAAVQAICKRAVLIDEGKIRIDSSPDQVIQQYFGQSFRGAQNATTDLRLHPNRWRGRIPLFASVTTRNSSGEPTTSFSPGEDLVIQFQLEPTIPISQPTLGIGIDNAMGVRIFSLYPSYSQANWERLDRPTTVNCMIPHLTLMPGRYSMSISVGTIYDSLMDAITHAACFDVEPNDYFGTGRMPTSDLGVVLAQARWEFVEG